MAIYFKFKSEKSYASLSVNESFTSVSAFKQKVYELRYKGKKNTGLCFGNDFDITVINAQTNESYDDKMLIPSHTSALIQRVPGARRGRFIDTTTIVVPGSHIPKSSASSASNSTNITTSASVSASSSGSITSSSSSSSCGNVIQADASGKKTEAITLKKLDDFPVELVCPLCTKPMKHATLTSRCCLNSFCDKCIRDHLIISNFNCVCGKTDMLTDYLIPNITVRGLINSMLKSGFTIPQPQTSSSTSASILAKTSAGACVAQPQTSASANVPIAQHQTAISGSKSPTVCVAAIEEAAVAFIACEEGKKRKRENSEDVATEKRYLMRTGLYPYNSFGMDLNGYMPKASLGVQ